MDESIFYKILKKNNITSIDPTEIRRELNHIRVTKHPDKQNLNGQFATIEDKKDFIEINDAIEFIDQKKPEEITAIIVRTSSLELTEKNQNKTLEVMKNLQTSLILATERTNYRTALSQSINRSINNINYSHFFPKLTLPIASAVLSFIWLFPSTIDNSPLSSFMNTHNLLFTSFWLYCLMITGMFWYFVFICDNFEKKLVTQLNDESFQNEFFMHFVRERNAIKKSDKELSDIAELFMAATLKNYLHLYFYMTVKKSQILFFKYSPYLSDYWDRGVKDDDIDYYQILKLEYDYEMSPDPVYGIRKEGRVTFSGLARLDQRPRYSFLKQFLLKNLENNLDQETIQSFTKNILLKAEERGIIEVSKTYSVRTFGEIYRIKDSLFTSEPREEIM
jgi:hypothetical protein